MKKKEIYILIGPAAIGKTTYTNKAGFPVGKLAVVSRDEVVGRVSQRYNLSFDDLYHFPPHDANPGEYISGFEWCGQVITSPSVVKHLHPFSYEYLDSINAEINYGFYNEFQATIRNPEIDFIVVDRVHMRKSERDAYFKYLQFRNDFVVCAVQFNFEDADTIDVIEQVSKIRAKELGKNGKPRTVPRAVQENMVKHYEPIVDSEGFNSIIKIDTLPSLREFIKNKKNEN